MTTDPTACPRHPSGCDTQCVACLDLLVTAYGSRIRQQDEVIRRQRGRLLELELHDTPPIAPTTTDPQPSAQLDREGAREWGLFRLQHYSPASRDGCIAERSITHDIAGDANLDAVLLAVADFLRAAGYAIDGPLVVEEGSE